MSELTGPELDALIGELSSFSCSVRIQKYARTTAIRDCRKKLWDFLRLTRKDVFPSDRKPPLIEDMSHDVWVCAIGMPTQTNRVAEGYGATCAEAIKNALEEYSQSVAED